MDIIKQEILKMEKLFENEKETKRAIRAAVNQAKKVKPYTECAICGHTPKPDEWSHVAGICFDCT